MTGNIVKENTGGGNGSVSYVDITVNLPLVTWTQSGGGMYYSVIQNAVPAGAKIIACILVDWAQLRTVDIFQFAPSTSNERNFVVMSPNNSFNTGSAIAIRVSYI